MTQTEKVQAPAELPAAYAGLQSLNKLVGTWKVSSAEIDGQVTYEWLEGGYFLLQRFDFVHSGHPVRGLEIIGYRRGFGDEAPAADLTSQIFDNNGNTFEYAYEVGDETLTIWGGFKGSPAYYRGEWSADGNINRGAWHYPDGGGYESTMTRIR